MYILARARACDAQRAAKRLRNLQRAREIQGASETSREFIRVRELQIAIRG